MKKMMASVLTIVLLLSCFSMVASAKVGDKVGTALNTDIVAYINHYAIPSYAVNGQSAIIAEDLRNFGFDVIWNQDSRSLHIYRNQDSEVNEMYFAKRGKVGSKYKDVLETDIRVYANGKQISSYNIDGYTLIPMEELYVFGPVFWVPEERALKMWVDGVNMSYQKQDVEIRTDIISEEQAVELVTNYMGGDLGYWVAGEKNYLSLIKDADLLVAEGKEYYCVGLRGVVAGEDGTRWSTALTWYMVAADGSEVFEGIYDNGRLIRY